MKKTFIAILIVLLCVSFVSCTAINDDEAGVIVAKANLSSVIELTCSFQASSSASSGFIISDEGFVLTNAHSVTASADRFIYEATEIKGKFYNSNEEYTFDIIAYDVEKDLAILKFKRNDLVLKPVVVGNSRNLNYGATVFTLGNAEGNGISMTKGIISTPKVLFKDSVTGIANEAIQIDAAINKGSSGGPLLDRKGKVIGIISFKIKDLDKSIEGIGFAIPSNTFMKYYNSIINELRKNT